MDPVNKSDANGHTFASAMHDFFGGIGKAVGDFGKAFGGDGQGSHSLNSATQAKWDRSISSLFAGLNSQYAQSRPPRTVRTSRVGPLRAFTPLEEVLAPRIASIQRAISKLNPRETFLDPAGGAASIRAYNAYNSRLTELQMNASRTAQAIANGHAFTDHVTPGRPGASLFSGINSRAALEDRVYDTMTNSTHSKALERGRTAYYNERNNTVVVTNPNGSDGGSAFPASRGLSYYENELK
jgi:hypothetical protein